MPRAYYQDKDQFQWIDQLHDPDPSNRNGAITALCQILLDAKGKYYRIRVGDYRVGFVFEQGAVTFVRCLNRKEIYRYFP